MPHSHDHSHDHAPANFGKAFAVGIFLNAAFVVIEFGYGYAANSLALMADAGHNLGDVLGLLAAWAASIVMLRAPTPNRTYGLKGTTILAALGNAVLLLVTTGAIAREALLRLRTPENVHSGTVMAVAAVGIAINGITAMMFFRGRKDDLNVRAAFQHMAYDALVAVGVVIGGFVIWKTGISLIDPILSLLICAVIIWGTWSLLRDSVHMALQGTPQGINQPEVLEYLQSLPGVTEVHDLHVWSMSTTEIALTAHIVVPEPGNHDELLESATNNLHDRFEIEHVTIQIEQAWKHCPIAGDQVV